MEPKDIERLIEVALAGLVLLVLVLPVVIAVRLWSYLTGNDGR